MAKAAKTKIVNPTIRFETQKAFETWLNKNHQSSDGIWLEMAKAGSGVPSVNYAQALNVALCFGWIDGQKKSVDDVWWVQRFVPRGARSIWSKVNQKKVAVLEEAGRMRPEGLAAVDAAKKDGRWDRAYDGQRTAEVPEDLAAELARFPKARAFFETLKSNNRYAILWRLQTAKKPGTRKSRLEKCVEMLKRGETFH